MSDTWITTVSELMDIFRGSLISLIPWIEKAKIRWKNEDAYDDWDNIAESLFENIVCASLDGQVAQSYNFPGYNLRYPGYESLDFIQPIEHLAPEKRYAFISFQTTSSPMDSVQVAELDDNDKVVAVRTLGLDRLRFSYIKRTGLRKERIERIEVVV